MFSLMVPDQADAVVFTVERSSCTQSGVRKDVQVPSSPSAFLEPADVGSWMAMTQPVYGRAGSDKFCKGLELYVIT